ncbi:Dihydroorotase [Frankliniella fusca]|uniref:Dihydroorotase n=1 Tax=Frankliniella fusca TaxID=407009 RepID=A0AAE1LP39_9NEOP|nr:Dihydroorotase [Frankliniella fusca]
MTGTNVQPRKLLSGGTQSSKTVKYTTLSVVYGRGLVLPDLAIVTILLLLVAERSNIMSMSIPRGLLGRML